MKQTTSRSTQFALQYIREKYGIMQERGYELVSVEDVPAGWQALFRKPGLDVKIFRARGEDDVSFRTGVQPTDEFFDIGSVVYAALGEKIPLASYDDLSRDLRKYIARIEAYFQGNPANIRDSLRAARKEYHEALAPVSVVPPQEPKRNPILYYPLLAVVVLLLFGALTTLYAVLLDRLFAAFSLEADSYGLFMGAGAVILAIGTLLVLRRWIKMG